MTGLMRTGSRVGFVLIAAATVLFSASCGCGGGSSSPPVPDYSNNDGYRDHYYPYDHPINRGIKYKQTKSWDRYYGSRRIGGINRRSAELLRDCWLAGAGYYAEAEHYRVEKGSVTGMSDWRSLQFKPDCRPDSLPEEVGIACATYSLATDNLGDDNVYLELTWEDAPYHEGSCWVAVYRPGTQDTWNWFRPGREMRIALSPLAQYRNSTGDQEVFIKVVVTGNRPAVLRRIALREYDVKDWDRHDSWRDLPAEESIRQALILEPTCNTDSLPWEPGVASAVYTLDTAGLDGYEVVMELDWVEAPDSADYCWVAVNRPGLDDAWNWFRPGPDMRIGLTPVSQYMNPRADNRIIIKVAVTGSRYCELREVVLHPYYYDWAR